MKNRDVEKMLQQAFQENTPNQWESIKEDAKNVQVLPRTITQPKKANTFLRFALVACAFLFLGAGSSYFLRQQAQQVDATIYLDVNPSVQIEVNQKDKVMQVNPLNEEGKEIIGTMDFKDSDLEVTVNALIGSMLRHGYLSDLKNSILISVDASETRALALEDRLSGEIDALLQESALEPSILRQTITENSTLKEKAEQYQISTGKAKLIEEITQNSLHEFDELVDLSINDLNLISQNKTDIQSSGEASQKGYIGVDQAITNALAYYNLTRNDVINIECDLDYEHGRMVYEVEFRNGQMEYDVDVDATTGEVVFVDQDGKLPPTTQVTQPTPQPSQNAVVPVAPQQNQTPSQNTTTLTSQEALNIVLGHAGVAQENAYDIHVEQDFEHSTWVYEIDFKSNGYEYDYEVDANNGTILRSEKEYDD